MNFSKLSLRVIVQLFSACLFLAACAPQATASPAPTVVPSTPTATTITLTDGMNRTITLAGPAGRVVSLAPNLSEILFAIGAGSQVVGRDEFSDFPAEVKSLPSVGGSMGKLNPEAILNLKPDLVLAAGINTNDQVLSLEKLGLTVFMLPNPTTMDEMYQNLETVARLTGRQAETGKLIDSLKQRVAAVDAKIASVKERPLVYYELDGTDPNAPYTAGPGSFVDQLIQEAGGQNVGSILKDQWAKISVEQLLVKNPDIIILGDFAYGVTIEKLKQRAGWSTLKAVKDGKIATFDDNTVSRPGPRLVDGLETMAKLFHPELFQ
jgi:iron complex transport system substrate-binding protein